MNARELHKLYSEYGIRTDLCSPNQTLILRALDLLARVEESVKKPVEVIERMRSKFVVSESDWKELLAYLDSISDAAALVALRAERDGLLRGEYICRSCGLRKNGEIDATPSF